MADAFSELKLSAFCLIQDDTAQSTNAVSREELLVLTAALWCCCVGAYVGVSLRKNAPTKIRKQLGGEGDG